MPDRGFQRCRFCRLAINADEPLIQRERDRRSGPLVERQHHGFVGHHHDVPGGGPLTCGVVEDPSSLVRKARPQHGADHDEGEVRHASAPRIEIPRQGCKRVARAAKPQQGAIAVAAIASRGRRCAACACHTAVGTHRALGKSEIDHARAGSSVAGSSKPQASARPDRAPEAQAPPRRSQPLLLIPARALDRAIAPRPSNHPVLPPALCRARPPPPLPPSAAEPARTSSTALKLAVRSPVTPTISPPRPLVVERIRAQPCWSQASPCPGRPDPSRSFGECPGPCGR